MVTGDRVYYRLNTHLEMLNDRVRCLAYQRAIESVVRDKIVLDVGCGSGLLSFFAARAGAKRVLAVDMDVPPGAGETARINGLAGRVEFFSGEIQEIDLPVDSVDIIVSEWMGGVLLMENMLPAVLVARDRWLKPGGVLLPDRARLFLAPLDNVAGLDAKRFPDLRHTISSQMWVSAVAPSRFLAEPNLILDLDLNTIKEPVTRSYAAEFSFHIERNGTLNGFGLWFDVLFGKTVPPVLLSTAPWLPPTHWSQALWILPRDIAVAPGGNISGTFSQVNITPSIASFRAGVTVDNGAAKESLTGLAIEATPSNMSSPGADEDHIAAQAAAGAYQGRDCYWIGCSMSFAALIAAANGARSVSILNHSPWAGQAMRQLAAQQGLNNVRFISELPPARQLQNKHIQLLGAADSSWQALLSHIKIQRALGQASFRLTPCWRESSWKQFYGFDFSAYAAYDLEMFHQVGPAGKGMVLEDITGQAALPGIIYTGMTTGNGDASLLADGVYNHINVDFNRGTVGLPLREPLCIDTASGKQLREAGLAVSVLNGTTCRFRLTARTREVEFVQHYDQPLTSMGHIIPGPHAGAPSNGVRS